MTISYDELKEHLDLSKNSWTVGVRDTSNTAPGKPVIVPFSSLTISILGYLLSVNTNCFGSSPKFQNFDGSSIHILKKDDSGNGLRGAVFEVQIDALPSVPVGP